MISFFHKKKIWPFAFILPAFFLAAGLVYSTNYVSKLQPAPRLEHYFEVNAKNLYQFFWKAEVINPALSAFSEIQPPRRSVLDNRTLEKPEEYIFAIMIENHPDSRPQMKGLSKAGIVYEALVEGGITRFMAVFSYHELEKIGPVRSARPYYVRLAQSYAGGYGHAGGSPDALAIIPETGLINLEGLFYEGTEKYFYRDYNYYAPHNLFANLIELKELLGKKQIPAQTISSQFHYGEQTADMYESAKKITIDFSYYSFLTEYQYDEENGTYARFLAGKPHIDSIDDSQIAPANIAVMITPFYVYDDYGRLKMNTVGEGEALVFSRGKVVPAVWKRPDSSSLLQFYDREGAKIPFASGQTWIAITDALTDVSWEEELNISEQTQ